MLANHLDSSSDMILLSMEEKIAPTASKTIRSFSFEVPEGTKALYIRVNWSPRFCSDPEINEQAVSDAVEEWRPIDMPLDAPLPADIQQCTIKLPNLVNVVLVDPEGRWRGRTDRGRGSKRPIVFTSDNPPPGFLEGPLTPGTWRAEVELHAVVPPECTVALEIATGSPPPAPTTRKVDLLPKEHRDEPGWYKGELHSHSIHSDGAYPVHKIVERARTLGLDFFTLTDHNTMAGIPELEALPFPTISGVELTTFHGHHIIVGAKEMVPWHRQGIRRPINEVVQEFRNQGGLFALSHPFSIGDPVCTGCRFTHPDLDPTLIDLVEIWHRRWKGERGDNHRALAHWNQLWQEGHRPTAIAVRDWHTKEHEDELPGAWPTTVIRARSTRPEDLMDGLRKGAAYVTAGPAIDFQIQCGDDPPLLVGDQGKSRGHSISIEVDIDTLEPVNSTDIVRAELYRCGEMMDLRQVKEPGTLRWADLSDDPAWYRIEFWRGDTPLAITNHIELK